MNPGTLSKEEKNDFIIRIFNSIEKFDYFFLLVVNDNGECKMHINGFPDHIKEAVYTYMKNDFDNDISKFFEDD